MPFAIERYIFGAKNHTYPIEIKEQTAAADRKLGPFFGLDVGPFVKLAFYAAKKGNLNSLFVVREIDREDSRNLMTWWYIKFEQLASFASWQPLGGGRSMTGGMSTVIKIPKSEFAQLDQYALENL